jgi:NADPH:quinone reductase-like Zn-dependent oxidoreductase
MTDPSTETPESSAVPTTMTAAMYDRYGAPEDVVRPRTVPVPRPAAGEVLIRVRAAAVNALDWHLVTGLPMFARAAIGLRRPRRAIPGADVAGTVAAVGVGVETFAIGDDVFGQVDGGGFAEYVTAPADWLVAKPQTLGFHEAATLGVAAETALQGLRDWGRLRPGQRVLLNGASGGVGTFAVQLAKALGAAHVTAVCSTGNVAAARQLGADRVIDYTREDATADNARYDLIFDNAGVWPLRSCRRLLADDGTYTMITAPKSRWLRPLPRLLGAPLYFAVTRTQSAVGRVATRSTADLAILADLAERQQIRPVIEASYPLIDAAEALRVQGQFHATGKSIIIP